MTLLLEHFDTLLATPADVEHLNRAILTLAVQGRLVEQNANDELASELLKRINKKQGLRKTATEKKATEAFDLPKSWEWAKLDDICYQITDGTHYTPSYQYEGVPFLSVKDVSKGYLDFRDTRLISQEEHEMLSARCKPEFGDVLLTKVGTTGIAVVVDTHQEFSVFVSLALLKFFQEEILPQYLSLVINSPFVKSQSEKFTMGVGNKNLVLKHIKEFSIPLPPLAEQKRIVTRVETLFTQTRALAEKLAYAESELTGLNRSALAHLLSSDSPEAFNKQWDFIATHFESLLTCPEHVAPLRQSILELAVRGKLTRREAGDESARELLKRIKAERVESGKKEVVAPVKESEKPFALPDGWEWARFGDIANIATNSVQPDNFRDFPHVAPNNIEKGTGKLLDYKTVGDDDVRSINHRFSPGQLLYSKIRPNLSKAVIVDFEGLCSADMYPLDVFINSKYLLRFILSSIFLNMVTKNDTRVAMPKVNQNELNKVLIAVPPLAEQARIVARVEQLLGLCEALESRLRAAQEERSRLVESVMGGMSLQAGSSEAAPC